MKQILDGGGQLIIGFDNLKAYCGWIYQSECALDGVFKVKGTTKSTQTMTQATDNG
jgi:hypothetical protein